MNAKIFEIFRSIQGEGKYVGVPQVFVRFFQCHMHCGWCDTPESIGDASQNFIEMSLEDVRKDIERLGKNCHSVSLTGGEPLLQKDFLKELLPCLKNAGRLVYLETSGVLHQALAEVIEAVDIVAMDFKLPSSTGCRPYWEEHADFLKIARAKDVFVKAVITGGTKQEDLLKARKLIQDVAPETLLILQPNYFESRNGAVKKCLAFQEECLKYFSNVRVIPQMHKVLRLR